MTYTSSFAGQPLEVLQILGYDDRQKEFQELVMDNMDTGMQLNRGSGSGNGKRIALHGKTFDKTSGEPAQMRTEYTIVDKDRFRIEWFQKTGEGEERATVVLEHSRQ